MNAAPLPDLFGMLEPIDPPHYPETAGFKGPRDGTSAEAAERITPSLGYFRKLVLSEYEATADTHPAGFTADEIADRLSLSILTARPRVSELVRLGYLIPTAERRPNAISGIMARVWKLAPPPVPPIQVGKAVAS